MVLRLPFFGALLEGVSIKKRSYQDALKEAKKKKGQSFVFLDPPYEGFAESMYGFTFDFDEFAEECHGLPDNCNIMITINDSDAIRERFEGLNVYSRDVYYGMSKKEKPELVICNYELKNLEYKLALLGFEPVNKLSTAPSKSESEVASRDADQEPKHESEAERLKRLKSQAGF